MIPFVLTGIPRSGTSLLSTLICEEVPNAYCINEVYYNVNRVKDWLMEMGFALHHGGKVPNKYYDEGLVTNIHDNERKEMRYVNKFFDDGAIGSKVTTPYLDHIGTIKQQDILTIALVRNPVYTLASWYSDRCAGMNLAHVTDDDMDSRWQDFDFESDTKLERQAELWNHYAKESLKCDHVYHYEDLVENPNAFLQTLEALFHIELTEFDLTLQNYNNFERYDNMKKVYDAVMEWCPNRKELGYE